MQQWPAPLRRHLLVFGAEPVALAEQHLQRLVTDQSREGDDLDFKRELYGRADKEKIAVSIDIAALANDRGGVIVLGVHEDGEVAKALCPVALDGDDQRWMREVAARHTAPHVPFDLLAVPSDADPTRGWLLIVVPPSPRRPHAVINGNNLRIPRRHGTTTRYLSEAELADMYRNRFNDSHEDLERSSRVMAEGLDALGPPRDGVLALALSPSAPGRMIVDGPTIARVKEWLEGGGDSPIGQARFWTGFFGAPPDVFTGRRRIVASSAWSRPHQPPYCELHTDGAGVCCRELVRCTTHGPRRRKRRGFRIHVVGYHD
jgi:Putative DNA-binding domain